MCTTPRSGCAELRRPELLRNVDGKLMPQRDPCTPTSIDSRAIRWSTNKTMHSPQDDLAPSVVPDPLHFSTSSVMATSRDAPNPLRPYYIPPSIGPPPDLPPNATSAPSYSSTSSKPSFGTQARDILSDLDYDSYFADSSPSLAEHARRFVDRALWNYTSVLLAQPFEVAKTILQIHQAAGQAPPGLMLNGEEYRSRPNSFASGKYEDVSLRIVS